MDLLNMNDDLDPNFKPVVDIPTPVPDDQGSSVTTSETGEAFNKLQQVPQDLVEKFKPVQVAAEKFGWVKEAQQKFSAPAYQSNGLARVDVALLSRGVSLSEFNVCLEEFTNYPTRSRYSDVMRAVGRQVALEGVELNVVTKFFFEEPLEDVTLLAHHFEKYYEPFIRQQALSCVLEGKVNFDDPKFIFPTGDKKFVNVVDTGIGYLAAANDIVFQRGAVEARNFLKACEAMRAAFSCIEFRAFVLSGHKGLDLNTSFETIYGEDETDDLTIRDLIVFCDDSLRDALVKLHGLLTSAIETYVQMGQDIQKLDASGESYHKYLAENHERLREAFAKLNFMENVVRNSMLFFSSLATATAFVKMVA